MNREELIDRIVDKLRNESLTVSPSTREALSSTRYLNDDLLKKTDYATVQVNIGKFTDELINNYEERTREAKRPTKVLDKDVRGTLRDMYCSLPPFCKST